MRTVTVITTGGTIASRAEAGGGKTAGVPGAQVLAGVPVPDGVEVRLIDLIRVNSYAMTPAQMDRIVEAIDLALADPQTCGVVVTHGTDTMEESAMLAALGHHDPRPVVFTGAQRSFDDPDHDGPTNLRDAIAVAACEQARDLGVLIVFAGQVHAAVGTRKVHTLASEGFLDVDRGPLGEIVAGQVRLVRPASSWVRLGRRTPIGEIRVDIVALYPGVDRVAIDAVVAAGAHAVVLQAVGAGNANPAILAAVREHVAAGIAVVLSTRVAAGEVRAIYSGNGGGVDLVAAGAVRAGLLRPGQARILLAALLADGASADRIAAGFLAERAG